MEAPPKNLFIVAPSPSPMYPCDVEDYPISTATAISDSQPNSKVNLMKSYFDRVESPFRNCSKERKGKCLTKQAWPLIRSFQLLGLFPLTLPCKSCTVSHSWVSIPTLMNLLIIVGNIFGSIGISKYASRYLVKYSGTDFYATTITMLVQLLATIFTFAAGSFSAKYFCRAWQILHDVSSELGIQDFTCIRWHLAFTPIVLLGDGIANMGFVALQMTSGETAGLTTPLAAYCGNVITTFVPNFMANSFASLLWISGDFFDYLNGKLESALEDPFQQCNKLRIGEDQGSKLRKLRRLHEELCEAVRLIGKCYGFQMLVIIPATAFRVVVGAYSLISTFFLSSSSVLKRFSMIEGFANVMNGGRLLLILFGADFIISKAKQAVPILQRARFRKNPPEVNEELDAFLSKIALFPLKLLCCGIINLELSFLAVATPNVITYVLVLMQFKQGDEALVCSPQDKNISMFDNKF